MKEYFNAANNVYRFTKFNTKKYNQEFVNPIPDKLGIELDDNFTIKGKVIYFTGEEELTLSDILRAFYYCGSQTATLDDKLTTSILATVDKVSGKSVEQAESSVFFREILKLPKNVGQTLSLMNELGVLGAFMSEWKDLEGFMQHGVYHCYTADEHTLITIQNLEKLEKDKFPLGKIFNQLKKQRNIIPCTFVSRYCKTDKYSRA